MGRERERERERDELFLCERAQTPMQVSLASMPVLSLTAYCLLHRE